jgi:hypothetical protein
MLENENLNEPQTPQLNIGAVSGRFFYEPTGQWTLTEGTIVYNFDTGEEDIIVDYKNGRSAITEKGRAFHCSAFALGGGWKAVRKTYR